MNDKLHIPLSWRATTKPGRQAVQMRITSSSQAIRILHGLSSFQSPGAVPGDVPLEPTDTLLGVLGIGKVTAAVLLDCGAYLQVGDEWQLVPYGDIEVGFPAREVPVAPLALITPVGTAEILSGTSDVWEVGRFFMRCAEDALAAQPGRQTTAKVK